MLGVGLRLSNRTLMGGGGAALPATTFKWTPEGDSITIGLGGTPAYPFAALSLMSGVASTPGTNTPTSGPVAGVGTVTVSDIATSGISSLTISTNYSTRGGASFDATKNINMFSLMSGTNTSGVNDTSALQKYLLNRGILRKAKTTGYQRRIIVDMIARFDDGTGAYFNGTLTTMNNWYATYYNVLGELDCDARFAFSTDSRFNTPSAIPTSIWYNNSVDFIHPSVLGEGPTGLGQLAQAPALAALQAAGTRVQAPMTWSIFDINASITLSNSNRTATSGANGALVVAGFPVILGKRYWEIVPTSGTPYIGITNDTNVTYAGGFDLFSNNNALAYISDGRIMINSVVLVTAATWTTNDVIQFAMDQPNKLIWIRRVRAGVAQNWNGSGTADPVAGVGGLSISALGNGTSVYIRPALEPSVNTAAATSNFAAAQLSGSIPTGFLALDQ